MIYIQEINYKDIDLCFELDSNTIALWSKEQWSNEFKKEGVKVFGIFTPNIIVAIGVLQVVVDEAQINYFAVKKRFQRKGYGSRLMEYLICECEKLEIKKLLLEVSERNYSAEKFYNKFEFLTVGIRKKYYKDGSTAFLKEKNF